MCHASSSFISCEVHGLHQQERLLSMSIKQQGRRLRMSWQDPRYEATVHRGLHETSSVRRRRWEP